MVSAVDLKDKIICIIGLGYVGFPLAEIFSNNFKVIGFDVNREKVNQLKNKNLKFDVTSDPEDIKKSDFIIITVPTPVTKTKEPDLSYIESASIIVGRNLKKDAIIVLESTVYPSITEEFVGRILERESGLILGKDFKVGYSPERVNPGDNSHTINKITKVVSGIDENTTDMLMELYGSVTNVYRAKNIKTAEAAKVIENIQRDINIALINEFAIIFSQLGIDIKDIIDAAATKWNFQRYLPGMVGGHCIPVDPYYLVYKAKELDYHPQMILAGRSVNDSMPNYVVDKTIKAINNAGKIIKGSKVLIMGLTFKENVDDTRETPVKKVIKGLKEFNCEVYGFDPLLSANDIKNFGVSPIENLSNMGFNCVIITVIHDKFRDIKIDDLKKIMDDKPIIIDIKRLFERVEVEKNNIYYVTL